MSNEEEQGFKLRFMMTRRNFLKTLAAGGTLYWLGPKLMLGDKVLAAPIPGGSLDPLLIPKFQTPMLIPPVMPKAAKLTATGGKSIDYYEISMKQFEQQHSPAWFAENDSMGIWACNRGRCKCHDDTQRPLTDH